MLGLGAWAKSQAVLLVPLWGLVMILRKQRRAALMLAIGGFGVVIPISIFVSVASGHPVYMSNNGGQTFALAHCPIKAIKYSDPKSNTGAEFGIPTVFQRVGQGDEEATWQDAH